MTSLLHHRFQGSDSEALSYLKDTGWTSRMATPSPSVHLLGAAALLALGGFAGTALALHNLPVGVAVGILGAALALLDAMPAVWTLTHREYTEQYLAARNFFGGGDVRLHPLLVLVGLPAMAFLAAAYVPAHATAGTRIFWGLLGAAAGLGLGLLRVAHARQAIDRSTD